MVWEWDNSHFIITMKSFKCVLTLSELWVSSTAVWAATLPPSSGAEQTPCLGSLQGSCLLKHALPRLERRLFWCLPRRQLHFLSYNFQFKTLDASGMKQLLQERMSWKIPIAASAWPSALGLGKRHLSTLSHLWNPAAKGEEPIFKRKLIERTFLLRMFVNRFFQQLLSWSPMEEIRTKLHDQRWNQPKYSGMSWSNFPFHILKNPKTVACFSA